VIGRRRERKITDYNEKRPSSLVRAVKWMAFPESATSKTKWTAGLVLGLVFVAVGAMFVMNRLQPDLGQQQQQEQAAVPTVAAAPAATATCPEAPAVEVLPEQVVLASYTPTWVPEGSAVKPSSATGGPTLPGPVSQCFARNPEGVLYAAASFAPEVATATDSGNLAALFTVKASHTGNYNALMADLPSMPPIQGRPSTEISGYRWNSYSPDRASLEIAFRTLTGPRAGSTSSITYTLTWESNDWKLIVPGKTDKVQTSNPTKKFTPWGGV
jgi:hypothetical protein